MILLCTWMAGTFNNSDSFMNCQMCGSTWELRTGNYITTCDSNLENLHFPMSRRKLRVIVRSIVIIASYFTIDNSNDGSFQPHSCNKADMEILVQDECLQAGTEEKQSSV